MKGILKKMFIASLFLSVFLIININNIFSESFPLHNKGKSFIFDYEQYGEFKKVGKDGFRFVIKDHKGLCEVAGEGVYPYEIYALNSPTLVKLLREKKLDINIWESLGLEDKEITFYKWATASEEPGVKQYFVGHVLKNAGHYEQALKAYYAVILHYNRSYCWAKDRSFVWFVAEAALTEIINICRMHPSLGVSLVDAYVDVINGGDTDPGNDIVIVDPGRFVKNETIKRKPKGKVINQRGKGRVVLKQYENGHWQVFVDDKPFLIKSISYGPTKIGRKPGGADWENNIWMWEDSDKNGKIDTAYDAWVDANKNNIKDENEKSVGDFYLMQQMGVNAIRVSGAGSHAGYKIGEINKELLRDMYKNYGIMVTMTDFFGAYTVGSCADWEKGTDYKDPKQRELMKASVKRMVMENKDEPYILMWIIGNENDMSGDYTGVNATRTNASKYPESYVSLLEETARMIHKIDPDHPVAVGHMSTNHLHLFKEQAPSIDVYGINRYNTGGFGATWSKIKRYFDRPVFIPEFGTDSYYNEKGERQDLQKEVLINCWEDIVYNSAGNNGTGNSIGGCFFEWLDEWWKDTHSGDSAFAQTTKSQFLFPTFDGYGHEEWLGIISQGDGSKSPFLRQPKEAYYHFVEEYKKSKK
ncbi:MAG: hypothetical protein KAI43_06710 [Candidatus Aureabacteria bacterium]|nr:hypothetical protein [Candidatus Auribacterota bacterium]